MKTKLRCLYCTLILTLICATSHGDIALSEPPDFGLTFGGPSLGTLDLGVNTISGNVFFGVDVGDLGDVVALTLPDGLEIVAIEMTVSEFAGFPDQTFVQSNTWLQGTGFIDGMSITGNRTVQFPAESLPISTPGVYDFHQSLVGVVSNVNADWQLTVTTAVSIPEPGSLVVFGLGLILFVGRRKHR